MAAGFGTDDCYSCGRKHVRRGMVTDIFEIPGDMGQIEHKIGFKRGLYCPPDWEKMHRAAGPIYEDHLRMKAAGIVS
jgi:hypothetical protein